MEPTNPKGEIVWIGHYDTNHELRFITTSKPTRECYFLYELVDGKFVKLGKDKNPKKLEEKFITPEKLGIQLPEQPARKRRNKTVEVEK